MKSRACWHVLMLAILALVLCASAICCLVMRRVRSSRAGGKQYLSQSVIGKTSRDIDANHVVWRFFEEHGK